MIENMSTKNSSIKFKVLIVPLMIMFIIVALISTAAITVTRTRLMSQMESDGKNLANQISVQLSKSSISMDALNESIEIRIKTLGDFIGNNAGKVNNDYLAQLAKQFEIDEINFTDPTGKVIYSNLETSIGATFDNKHISYCVLTGEKPVLMENIRKSRENNNYYKYGYIRKSDGGIIQIGMLANKVQALSASLETQTLVQDLVKDNGIVYAAFIDKNLKVVAHSDKEKTGKTMDDDGIKEAVLNDKPHCSIYLYKGNTKVQDIMVPVHKNGVNIGAVDIGISTESLNKTIYNMMILIVIIAILAFLISSIIMIKIAKNIINPLSNLVEVSKKIAQGEFDNEIKVKSNDEIGVLALSFKHMSDRLKETIGAIKDEASKVENMASRLTSNAEQMTSAASEVTDAVQNVTQGATQQANDLMEVVNHLSSLDEEIEKMQDKLSHVKESSDLTEKKAEVGKNSIDVLLKSIDDIKNSFKTVEDKVNSLNLSVSQVGNITDVINGISEQTNLLALNAAIEAARAGETGKGFAVVAEEVRRLAEQSKNSTDEIQKLIQSISSETSNVIITSDRVKDLVEKQVDTVQSTITSFNDMLKSVSDISPLVEDTYISIQNTIKSKDIVLNKVETVTSVAQETSASSEEISASSEEMLANSDEVSKYAGDLNEVVQKLTKETSKFSV